MLLLLGGGVVSYKVVGPTFHLLLAHLMLGQVSDLQFLVKKSDIFSISLDVEGTFSEFLFMLSMTPGSFQQLIL